MKFILYKEDKNIFNFRLKKEHEDLFSNVVENIVLSYIEKEPITLEIYKQFNEEFSFD